MRHTKVNGMKPIGKIWKRCMAVGIILLLGTDMTAQAGWFGLRGESWEEEVRLQDGTTMIAKRTIHLGAWHELGQQSGIQEESISFTVPGTQKRISWVSEYSKDIGRANFEPLALHVQGAVPYIVTTPNLCLSYNKWGRLNPPYVIFRYDGKAWQRIPLSELPSDLTTINLLINTISERAIDARRDLVSAQVVKNLNSSLQRPEYQTILREPLPAGSYGSLVNCEELVYYKGYWVGPGDSIGKRMADRMSK